MLLFNLLNQPIVLVDLFMINNSKYFLFFISSAFFIFKLQYRSFFLQGFVPGDIIVGALREHSL